MDDKAMDKQRLFASVATATDGRQVLRYFEPNGDETIIHNVFELSDGIQVDAKLTIGSNVSQDALDKMYRVMVDEFDTASADKVIEQTGLLTGGLFNG